MIDLRVFIKDVESILESHKLDSVGAYKRWLSQDGGNSRHMNADVYGCSDAANILYTIGELQDGLSETDRSSWISMLQSFQDKETGLFHSEGMSPIHTTAFVAGALELFDARPKHPIIGLKNYAVKENLISLLENLDWVNNPWGASHNGSGIYAAIVLTGTAPIEWEDWYFEWLSNNVDSDTGFWKKNSIFDENGKEKGAPIFHHLASSFHYVFNYEYAKRPIPFPERMIDSCIRIYNENLYPPFSNTITYNEIDFIYLLSRCLRRTGHRFEEGQNIIKEIAKPFINYVLALDCKKDDGINDLHNLFAVISALAVIQDALPGLIKTEKPLRLVLDRRPFL